MGYDAINTLLWSWWNRGNRSHSCSVLSTRTNSPGTFLARNIQINTSDWRLFEHRADKEWLFRAVVIGICWCSWWLTFMTKHERSVLHADNKLLDANGYHWSGYNTLRFSNFRTLLFSYDRFTIRRTVILTNEISENRNAIKLYVQIWIYSDVFVFVRTKVVT